MISREEALELLGSNLGNINLVRHCLATEAVMRKLAEDKDRDTEVWGLAGLLHDLDYELTSDDHSKHALVGAEMLDGRLPEEALHAIRSHNSENNGTSRESEMDHLLAAAESITGLIVAICGGLDSIIGALIAGLFLGIVENVSSGYLDPLVGGGVKDVASYTILLLVLLVRPYGLFGLKRIERI